MDALDTSEVPWKAIAAGIALAVLVILTAFLIIRFRTTRPLVQGFVQEGFVATNGVGAFPCSQESSEAAQLYAMFKNRDLSHTEDGKEDLRHLKNLLSKICCMRRDLMSPSGLITAVNEVRFDTQMDIQPVADTTARCLSKQIPERDLDIQFIKWYDQGTDLIKRLCTDGNLSEEERVKAENLFQKAQEEAQVIAKTQCLTGVPEQNPPSPRDPRGYSPPEIKNLRNYDGYQ